MTRAFSAALIVALALGVAFLALPVVALLVDVPPADLVRRLDDGASLDALRLSLQTTAIALAAIVAIGTPAAYLLATRRFPGRSAIETVLELPLVLPPAVAGIALLSAFGPQGLLGGALDGAGLEVALTTTGVVLAQAFVASPLYVRQAQAAFAALDPTVLEAARTLGASPAGAFVRVAVPLARPALLSGAALAWGRALGEFGATLIVAGSFRGVSQTAPLAIYELFGSDFDAALALSVVLLAVSVALLAAIKLARPAAA
ncbi:MAG: molybdate transport system permease protein [Solirubrobacteraceae bacterium]|jgi:molybdate transport system permease protein|nr:molybdate transport system permease protein [Solirubrobacteraceae bacterium]